MFYQGLSEQEVLEQQKKYGENVIARKKQAPWFSVLFSQFKNPLIYILLIVGAISLSFRDWTEAILIVSVVVLNVIMGFFQEYSAQRTLRALHKILQPTTIVIRDSKRKKILAKNLVPGDLVVLGAGDKAPADGKMIEGASLLIDESILTGESEAISKNPREQNNKIFMGTTILAGRGIVKIEKIGAETEIGKIGKELETIEKEKTPLQIKLEKFSRDLGYIILGICLLIFVIGLFHGQEPLTIFKISIILAVAAIPEGLPIAITVILSLGMRRILKKKGLVRKLLSIETLGSTSIICTDKTGTLTQGKMQVARTNFTDEEKAKTALFLTNEQRSGLESAVWDYINGNEIIISAITIHEEPFDSEKKYALSVNQIDNKKISSIVGAPEIILNFCRLEHIEQQNILNKIKEWGSEGLKILGVASKQGEDENELKTKNNFQWLGILAIEDPIRPQAKEAISRAWRAGINVKIVTGDFKPTAVKVAEHLGFNLLPENIMDGAELENISDDKLKEKIDKILLFARITPLQKQKIIRVLQEKGEIVAMTGDGVNDAPALKKADIGVAMESGSEVAKEASDLVLLDNNFKTIVDACEEGRLIFANIKKVVNYALSNSFVETILIFAAMLLGLPAPLTVAQILWLHLICDGPPDIILSFEPKEKGLMQKAPKNIRQENILDNSAKFLIFAISLITGLAALVFFAYFLKKTEDLQFARTIVFLTVASVDLIYIFSFKSSETFIFQMKNFFRNKYLFVGVAYGFALIFLALYAPIFQRALGSRPLETKYWLIALSVGIFAVIIAESVKIINKLKNR